MNRFLIVALLFLLSSSVSLVFLLHNQLGKIDDLEKTIGAYETTIERNNNTISSLRQDIEYTETILTTLQETRKVRESLHRGVSDEWERVKVENRNESDNTVVDLSDYFRVLRESACNTNRDCL